MANENTISYIDDPVAFYLYNKIDCMRETDLISICKNFYTESEVSTAKDLIYETYELENEKIVRKGQNKILSDLQDIIRLIRNKPALINKKFCVTACTRLPAVSLEHIDVGALLSQVSELRMQINKLQNIQRQVDDNSNSISELKGSISNVRSPFKKKYQVKSTTPSVKEIIDKLEDNEGQLNDKGRLNKGNILEDTGKSEGYVEQEKESLYPDLAQFSNIVNQNLNCSVTNDDIKDNFIVGELDSDFDNNVESDQLLKYRPSRTIYNRKRSDQISQSSKKIYERSSNFRSLPAINRTDKNISAIRHDQNPFKLRAATHQNSKSECKLFVSRVSLEESTFSVRRHILDICGRNTKVFVQRIETLSSHFNSFKAIVYNKPDNINLLNPKNWPRGIVVRIFKN